MRTCAGSIAKGLNYYMVNEYCSSSTWTWNLLQAFILISLTYERNMSIMSMPRLIRALVYITTPFLMAPVVLHLYSAYLQITKKIPQEIAPINNLISSFKMGEVAFESIPQLATQWAIVQINSFKDSDIQKMISSVQYLSIATSMITIVTSILFFIILSRRNQFISSKYHDAASLIPIVFWLLTAILSGTTGLRSYLQPEINGMCSLEMFVFNIEVLF
jgi:hypothetical protein